MPEKNEKYVESVGQSGGWKGRKLWMKRFVEKMSFKSGVEVRSNGW